MNPVSSRPVFFAKLIRRCMRRRITLIKHRRSSFLGVPILFGNSFPKSGTHLLTQVLAGFTKLGPAVDTGLPTILTFDGPTGRPRPIQDVLNDLYRLQPGDVAYGHLHATLDVIAVLCRDGIAPYFIYRDPRDVVVSHVFYVTEIAPRHVHHQYYRQELHSFDERLRVSILGRPDADIPFPDIRGRFEPYLGWLDQPEAFSLRFEDLVTRQDETLLKIFDHALSRGFPTPWGRETALGILRASINPERSPTFRRGKVGGWQEHFTESHKELFKEVAGDLLICLGYEQDNDW
ncbi:MAG: hypothetical protein AB1345_00055 [Chloroflexota bacterium]